MLEVNACFQLQLDDRTFLPLVKNSSYAPAAFYITIHAQEYCLPNEREIFIANAAGA